MKNHLVPEQRTDKNGVTKTRWVRPGGSGVNTSAIPAPIVPANASNETKLLYTALETFKNNLSGDAVANIEFLGKNSPKMLEQIIEQCTDKTMWTLWHRHLTSGNINSTHLTEYGIAQKVKAIEDRILVFPIATDLVKRLGDYSNSYQLMSNVGDVYNRVNVLMRHGVQKNVDHAPELIQAVTIISVVRGVYASALWRMDNTNTLFSDIEEDARYVSEHLEEVMMLVPELVERKSHDVALLKQIIESDAPALGSGSL